MINYGCLPRTSKVGDGEWPVMATSIPRTDWLKWIGSDGYSRVNLRTKVREMKDQGSTPSCASQATIGSVQIVRAWNGLAHVSLSAASIFHYVGGVGGSSVDDNLRRVRDVGCCTAATWANNDWRRNPPANYQKECPLYRVLEWDDLPDFDIATSCILEGRPVVFGVDWQGGGGHAICGVRVVYREKKFGWEILNSWGDDYGDKGFGILWEPQISRGIATRYGAWAPRVVVISGAWKA